MMENKNGSILFRETIGYTDKLRDLFKRQNYEEYILIILNRSSVIFRDRSFYSIKKQSNGEADFKDDLGRKYEVKLVITTEQGSLIGERKNDLIQGIQSMNRVGNEYASILENGDLSLIKETILFKTMKERIESIEKDETAILFIPFMAVMDNSHSIYGQFSLDFIQATYDQLSADGIIDNKDVYFIYPSIEKDVYVLRDKDYQREYIPVPELGKFMSFLVTPNSF